MKILRLVHGLAVAGVIFTASSISTQAQTTLGFQLYAGISITGSTGSVYAVQATSDTTNPNSWQCLALVQLPTTNVIWTDTSKTTDTGKRFYRTVLTATNLVFILPGTFTMGSPTNEALRGTDEVQHVVTISKGFYMGKFPVTQAEYHAIIAGQIAISNFPAVFVKWADATNYCGLRTASERIAGLIPTNWAYRLPTESEWEYACRAGTVSAFYTGSSLHSSQANFLGTNSYDAAIGNLFDSGGVIMNTTTNVGNYLANGWGLYDMAGNVDEWCQDWYGPYPSSAVVDPQGPAAGSMRARHGGRYLDPANLCRSACRAGAVLPTSTGDAGGFRVVLAQQ
jgi:formylglycine-generating enzyme required for sulfatase activity